MYINFRKSARKSGDKWTLDERGFQSALKSEGLASHDHALIHKLFRVFDTSNNNCVDFREFVTGLAILLNGEDDEMIALSFQLYDVDKSGYLEGPEILHLLQSMNVAVHSLLDHKYEDSDLRETVKYLMEVADLDRDGRISFSEYSRVMKEQPHVDAYTRRTTPRAGDADESKQPLTEA